MMIDLGLRKSPEDSRVVVAMSGGVDSSVTAGLLAESGYQVIGMTLRLYDHGKATQKPGTCCAGADIHDARRVAEQYGFPHYVLNYESRFRQSVIDDFAAGYLRGETPIPCVRCNQRIKFEDLLDTARHLEADALVTGHYVRRLEGNDGPELHAAIDQEKDQSYFLFATTRAQLAFLRFPLGHWKKEETRTHAHRLGLAVSTKPDSQDLCFVPEGNYADLVAKLRPEAYQPGPIIHMDGDILGQHQGIAHFTIGQRKGLKLGGLKNRPEEPLYVVALEPKTQTVIVGPREATGKKQMTLKDINWLGRKHSLRGNPLPGLTVKLRSTGEKTPAMIAPHPHDPDRLSVTLETPQSIAPGQACVFYDQDHVLGGGWIEA